MKIKKIIIWFSIIILFFLHGCNWDLKTTSISENNQKSLNFSSWDYDFYLSHNDLNRKYIVHVPKTYNKNEKTPVVLVFHWGGWNADNGPEYFGLNEKSENDGFIVVYVEWSGKKVLWKTFATWNAGRCCSSALKNNVDDVGFVSAMIEKLKSDFNADEKKIYATGMSNGAQMVYRLACELSDKIAAIAPSGSQGTFDNCQPKRPVPVLHIQGKIDPCSYYEWGTCWRCMADFWNKIWISVKSDDWKCIPIPDYINAWRIRNGCSDELSMTFENKGAICETYVDCQQNAEVTLCTVDGLGHNWSGQTTYGNNSCDKNPNWKVCKAWKEAVWPLNQDIIANDQIWDFFQKHPMN